MTHGWPGSVIELLDTVGPLTDPTAHGGSAEDAFHLVLPSLPGYGFSGEPAEVGWDLGRTARAWAELMRRLGYTRYVAQGGDVGRRRHRRDGPPGTRRAGRHPHQPARAGAGRHADADGHRRGDARRPRSRRPSRQSGNGYFVEMATRPQTIGYALLDSPVALAAWMIDHDTDAYYKIARAFVDGQPSGNLTRDHILDNITLYWLTGTGASAARSYWEAYGPDAPAAGQQPLPATTIPFGFTTFPARSGGRRAAGSRRATRTSSTSTRSTRAATSPPGKSRSSSRPSCAAAFRLAPLTSRKEQHVRDNPDRRPRARRVRRRLELERRDRAAAGEGPHSDRAARTRCAGSRRLRLHRERARADRGPCSPSATRTAAP